MGNNLFAADGGSSIDSIRSTMEKVYEKLETVVPIIENGLIQDLLFREYFKEDIDNYKTLLGIKAEYGYMACLVFGREQIGNYMTSAVAASIQAQKSYREIHKLAEGYIDGIMGSVMSNKIPILIPCTKKTLSYNARNAAIEKGRELCKTLSEKFDMNFRIGFGSVKHLERMAESYEEANAVLIATTCQVAHADDMPKSRAESEDYSKEIEKKLLNEVLLGNMTEATALAQKFFDWLEDNYLDDKDSIRLKCLELVFLAEHAIYEKIGKIKDLKTRSGYFMELMGYSSVSEMRLWFTGEIKKTAYSISHKKEENTKSAVIKAKAFINENYMKELSLDEVSKEVNISSYYFSKVFKEETGENFIDYLTKRRIEAAKKFLKTTNKSMKEISLIVGYSDPNYFSRNFKKITGKTPTDYAALR